MAGDGYNHLYLAREERSEVNGELAEVRLTVFRDQDAVHVSEGDSFVTIKSKIDLFEEKK